VNSEAWINIYTLLTAPGSVIVLAHKTLELAEKKQVVVNADMVWQATQKISWDSR